MAVRNLGVVDRFVAGAIGEPGDRTFLLEVEAGSVQEWFLVEKRQVAALILQAAQLLDEAGLAGAAGSATVELRTPDVVTFRVGHIDLRYREEEDTIEVVLLPVDGVDEEPVEFSVRPDDLGAMARHAASVVERGRPPCPRCGLAMNPEGHHCPVDNGDLRDHRP